MAIGIISNRAATQPSRPREPASKNAPAKPQEQKTHQLKQRHPREAADSGDHSSPPDAQAAKSRIRRDFEPLWGDPGSSGTNSPENDSDAAARDFEYLGARVHIAFDVKSPITENLDMMDAIDHLARPAYARSDGPDRFQAFQKAKLASGLIAKKLDGMRIDIFNSYTAPNPEHNRPFYNLSSNTLSIPSQIFDGQEKAWPDIGYTILKGAYPELSERDARQHIDNLTAYYKYHGGLGSAVVLTRSSASARRMMRPAVDFEPRFAWPPKNDRIARPIMPRRDQSLTIA